MRALAILSLLMLVSCGDKIRGGVITGKYTKIASGLVTDTTKYYLQVKKNNQLGVVEVTKDAWRQAKQGSTWPFEVK